MKILGIHEAHDASAALLIDGEIVAAAQEERWTGLKGDYGYPKHAIDYCLSKANITPQDLDIVALNGSRGWNPVLTKIKRNANFTVDDWVKEQNEFWKYELGLEENFYANEKRENYYDLYKDRKDFKYDDFYPIDHLLNGYMDKSELDEVNSIRKIAAAKALNIPQDKIRGVVHEDCHTAYAYYGGFLNGEDVISLTAEGCGDYSNSTLSVYSKKIRGDKIELSFTTENHLAHIYQYITLLLGMKPAQHEYKVMGLAPYASKYEMEKSYPVFRDILEIGRNLLPVWDKKPRDLYFHFKDALEGHRFDGIAAALQMFTEAILKEWLHEIIDKFREQDATLSRLSKVIFSGGVAQNVKANMAMANLYWCRIPALSAFCVLPAAGDTSSSIGACYQANLEMGGGNKPISNFYLGPDTPIKIPKDKYYEYSKAYTVIKASNKIIAKLLSEGKIIARCCGRMEFGLRALGNRSILADPRDIRIVKKINEAVKNRDFWMPFAPVILRERAEDYLRCSTMGCKVEDRFMTMAFQTTELAQKEIPAAIHPADFTCRPQVIDREDNPDYYDIVKEFESITGVGALLNTSLNLHGEPICLGAEEAMRVFWLSEIDGIILGDYLLLKKER